MFQPKVTAAAGTVIPPTAQATVPADPAAVRAGAVAREVRVAVWVGRATVRVGRATAPDLPVPAAKATNRAAARATVPVPPGATAIGRAIPRAKVIRPATEKSLRHRLHPALRPPRLQQPPIDREKSRPPPG